MLNVKYSDLKKFIPDITCGKVIKVYDGDTITIATRIAGVGAIDRFSVRFMGIDTPEIRTKNKEEKEVAKKARDFLKSKIMNKIVTLKDVDYDKYGRILAFPYLDDISLSDLMIKENFAVAYDGGKKTKVDWKKYNETGEL